MAYYNPYRLFDLNSTAELAAITFNANMDNYAADECIRRRLSDDDQSRSGNVGSLYGEIGELGANTIDAGENLAHKGVLKICEEDWKKQDKKLEQILEKMSVEVLEELIDLAGKRAIKSKITNSLGFTDYYVPAPNYKKGDTVEKLKRIKMLCKTYPQIARKLFDFFATYPLEHFISKDDEASQFPKGKQKEINCHLTFTPIN